MRQQHDYNKFYILVIILVIIQWDRISHKYPIPWKIQRIFHPVGYLIEIPSHTSNDMVYETKIPYHTVVWQANQDPISSHIFSTTMTAAWVHVETSPEDRTGKRILQVNSVLMDL